MNCAAQGEKNHRVLKFRVFMQSGARWRALYPRQMGVGAYALELCCTAWRDRRWTLYHARWASAAVLVHVLFPGVEQRVS